MALYIRKSDKAIVRMSEPIIASNGKQYVKVSDGKRDYHIHVSQIECDYELDKKDSS